MGFVRINKRKWSHKHYDFLFLSFLKISCLLALLSIAVQ